MNKKIDDDKTTKVIKPLVFISHDARDAALAEAFASLLKSVSAGVLKSFRTSDKKGTQGIEYGVEWYPEIIKNIQEASDVVCLLTANSTNRPWILFEAGMAKGKLDTSILGIALGISLKDASTGPFAQFQNCSDDDESLTKLVFQLVDRIPNSEPDEDTIRFQVGKFRDKVGKLLKKSKSPSKTETEKNQLIKDDSTAKLFEEIKVMFQDLPSRISKSTPRNIRTRPRRIFHPMMIEEIAHLSNNPTIGLRLALSFYKDLIPWIYDLGIYTLEKVIKVKTKTEKRKVIGEFIEILEMSSRHPLIRESYIEYEDDYIFIKEMPRIIRRYFRHIAEL